LAISTGYRPRAVDTQADQGIRTSTAQAVARRAFLGVNMLEFALFFFGFWAGVAVMCVLHIAAETSCNQDCNQGRECDCAQTRRNFESET